MQGLLVPHGGGAGKERRTNDYRARGRRFMQSDGRAKDGRGVAASRAGVGVRGSIDELRTTSCDEGSEGGDRVAAGEIQRSHEGRRDSDTEVTR